MISETRLGSEDKTAVWRRMLYELELTEIKVKGLQKMTKRMITKEQKVNNPDYFLNEEEKAELMQGFN